MSEHNCSTCPSKGNCDLETAIATSMKILQEDGALALVDYVRGSIPPVPPPPSSEESKTVMNPYRGAIEAYARQFGPQSVRKFNTMLLDGASGSVGGALMVFMKICFEASVKNELEAMRKTVMALSNTYLQKICMKAAFVEEDGASDAFGGAHNDEKPPKGRVH